MATCATQPEVGKAYRFADGSLHWVEVITTAGQVRMRKLVGGVWQAQDFQHRATWPADAVEVPAPQPGERVLMSNGLPGAMVWSWTLGNELTGKAPAEGWTPKRSIRPGAPVLRVVSGGRPT